MNYNEIIGLEEYFQETYDLTGINEHKIWNSFIPTKQFFEVLKGMLDSIESKDRSKRKSVWLKGTYGTGKSHATAVIKHLLSDDISKIDDYMEKIKDNNIQMYHQLSNFRKNQNHRIFPVVLKGISSITNIKTFAFEIEKSVEKEMEIEGLIKEDFLTKSDFDKYIQQISNNTVNWDEIIKDNRISLYVKTKEDLIDKLKKRDNEILLTLEDVFSKKDILFTYFSIQDYLKNILKELTNKNKADSLIIFWDEFTAVVESQQGSAILSEIQNIAELSNTENIYLFLVNHRDPYQASIPKGDAEKTRDRFKILQYLMEPVTTYHLIGASIKKKNKDEWKNIKDKKIKYVEKVIQQIVSNESNIQKNVLEDMFPIHPFTAALSVLIAREIGSTERSIFKFLDDDNKGFGKFINNNPDEEGKYFLTPEYLWDFFYEEFERKEDHEISPVLSIFKSHLPTLEKKGDEYIAMFKGILLLNILYRKILIKENSLYSPSKENLLLMFKGNEYKTSMEDVLTFIDSSQIVSKTPAENLYLLTGAQLPYQEINQEVRKKKDEINNKNVEDIFDEEGLLKKISSMFDSDIREIWSKIFDANIKEINLQNKLERFKSEKQYAIHLAIFIGREQQVLEQIKKTVNAICKEEDFKNITFVIISKLLSEDILNKYIQYWASADVAKYHSYKEDEEKYRKYMEQTLEGWVNELKNTYLDWFISVDSEKVDFDSFKDIIKNKISKKVFPYGFENISKCEKSGTIWKFEKAYQSAKIFLSSNDRKQIEDKTKKGQESYLRGIIYNNNEEPIVDKDLKFKEYVDDYHPLKKMDTEIAKKINDAKNKGVFNLGETLSFLSKPPYGIYPNKISMAAMGFLMRKYIKQFYENDTGKPIDNVELMIDKIKYIFNYFQDDKKEGLDSNMLDVRLGTQEEEKLIQLLLDVFGLSTEDKSINDVRWHIKERVKDNSCPIWAYKLSEKSNENTNNAIDLIFELTQNINNEISFENIKHYLENIENVEYDLKTILKKDNGKDLFKKWLRVKVKDVEIYEEKMDDVISYLEKNMQEEIGSWTEEKVESKVKSWQLEKLNKNKNPQMPSINETNKKIPIELQQRSDITGETNSIEEIKSKIASYDKEKLKKLFVMVLENYSYRSHLIPAVTECIKKLEDGKIN